MSRSLCFAEPFVRRHESLEHWRNELGGIGCGCVAIVLREDLGISDKVTVNDRRKFDGDLDRAIVLKSGKFELCHDGSFFAPYGLRTRS